VYPTSLAHARFLGRIYLVGKFGAKGGASKEHPPARALAVIVLTTEWQRVAGDVWLRPEAFMYWFIPVRKNAAPN